MPKARKNIITAGLFIFFILSGFNAFAQEVAGGVDLVASMVNFIFQLSIIIFAAKIGAAIFEKLKLPSVLGEILAGVLIGPYLLGALPIFGFEKGVFPLQAGFPITNELYGIATIASIVLLFLVGLETDIETLLNFSVAGFAVGLGGVIVSFIFGDLTSVLFSKYLFGVQYGFGHPVSLFMGIISTATSVGITARILTDKRKMDSPEGVTIVAGAVIDDVLGIITLAIVISVIKSGKVSWAHIGLVSLKAIGIWLGFTIIGLSFSHYLSEFLKKLRDKSTIAVISFALALFLAGLFERSGLAMIIGAYVIGISLSKTDLSLVIRENLSILYKFFVPIFFCVMGMLVNIKEITSGKVIIFGLIYVVFAVLGKLIGCGIPPLFLNFNGRGALRIGVGMIPRGEVALIIAGIGLSTGILIHEAFSVAVLMTFLTTLITPPIFAKMLESEKPVMKKELQIKTEHKEIVYHMPNPETAELILSKVIEAFENEGFYVHLLNIEEKIYQIRKYQTFIAMRLTHDKFIFECLNKDTTFIHTLFYEVISDLDRLMEQLQRITDIRAIGKKIFDEKNGVKIEKFDISKFMNPLSVEVNLKSSSKTEIIEELIDILIRAGKLNHSKRKDALKDLLEREASMSTGMENGIALPHAKSDAVNHLVCVVGLKKEGVEFSSLDGKPSKIFILTLSPSQTHEAYLQFMSEMSKMLINKDSYNKILSCEKNAQLYGVINSLI